LAVITGCLFSTIKLCSDKEAGIKRKLKEQGIKGAMEDCGFVPEVEKAK